MVPGKKSTNKTALRWLFKRVGAARTWILLSVGLGLSGGVLLVFQARFLARIIHGAFMENRSVEVLLPFFMALVGIIILRAIIGWAREVAGFQAGAKIRQDVRMALLKHIISLGPSYTSRQSTGALTTTALEHVEGLHDYFAFYLPQLTLAVMIPAAILAFVFPFSWAAGTLLLVSAPLIPLFMILVGMGAESISQRHYQALARMSAYFLDVLQGLSTLRLFDRSKGEDKKIAEVSKNYRIKTMAVLRVAFLSSAVLEFLSSISIALVAVYLGMSYLGYFSFGFYGKPLNLSAGFFILLLAPDFYLPLRELGAHYHARAEAVGAAEEILKIMSVPGPEAQRALTSYGKTKSIHIQFRDVYLTYNEGRLPALRGVSFDLKAGELVTLVGASGAGKTTVLNLLLGFLQPDKGRILVNETSLDGLASESWRESIAWIGQHPVLFHGTIRENILLGKPEASAGEIQQAAHAAGVLEFSAHLPEGLDTMVGEQGMGLSRGQAQRVALARAFIKNAPILLLDEPTAGLDVEHENLVVKALNEFSKGRTVLLLTHRLENIKQSDRILVLEDGALVEQGIYGELMAADGAFRRLVNKAPGA
jgi:ATP-binding cassette subfamily C protein CydD